MDFELDLFLIALTTSQNKARLATYKHSRKTARTGKETLEYRKSICITTNKVREEINEILRTDIEKRARFVKQTYYESGPPVTRLFARRLRKQQANSEPSNQPTIT